MRKLCIMTIKANWERWLAAALMIPCRPLSAIRKTNLENTRKQLGSCYMLGNCAKPLKTAG